MTPQALSNVLYLKVGVEAQPKRPTDQPSLEERVTRLEMIVVEAGVAAANISKLAAKMRRQARRWEALASALAMAASHLEDVLGRLSN